MPPPPVTIESYATEAVPAIDVVTNPRPLPKVRSSRRALATDGAGAAAARITAASPAHASQVSRGTQVLGCSAASVTARTTRDHRLPPPGAKQNCGSLGIDVGEMCHCWCGGVRVIGPQVRMISARAALAVWNP